MTHQLDYDVIIAGGGPAGSSAAIHLALRGAHVLLAEQKKFPRPKLCGEFISPECGAHFERLGVAHQMFASGPSSLTETVFYSRNGTNVSVPSDWFRSGGVALGLSRAEMDERLLRRAVDVGVKVLEDAHVVNLVFDNEPSLTVGLLPRLRVTGVTVKSNGRAERFRSALTIDATGRARTLARMAERISSAQPRLRRPPMVAFKTHLKDTRVSPGACEIYFYRGGYGGLSSIENGLSNLCFIANSRDVRACQSDADRVMREIVCQNQRASFTLANARVQTEWLAVSLEGFGRHAAAPADGLLAIGDAASFIDPFTGSGMLMALESGGLAADIIGQYLPRLPDATQTRALAKTYTESYHQQFSSRLRLCSLIRRAAFVPGMADVAIRFFGASEALRRRVSRATRSRTERDLSSAHSFK
jgi:flavin-dependent dehydrogenase